MNLPGFILRRLSATISARGAEIMQYIHERAAWPKLYWDSDKLAKPLAEIRHQQGYLLGRMSTLGFTIRAEASLEILTSDAVKSSAIEGEVLDPEKVRSSLASRLGIDIGGVLPKDRHVEGFVDMMLDATSHHQKLLTKDRLFSWHSALFPTGKSGLHAISVGAWRPAKAGPMRVVSGPFGREKIHFEAPEAKRLAKEMRQFLEWFNSKNNVDAVLKAGIAHFWFVTIHPFEDGNGRIARAIADLCLARADGISERFYSLSTSIEHDRKNYYDILEKSQKNGLDITPWLEWFLTCLGGAIKSAEALLEHVLKKSKIWEKLNQHPINDRQRKIINRMLSNFEGNLTTSKYAKIAKCSQDTALRDIQSLISYGVMRQKTGGGRSTNYELC